MYSLLRLLVRPMLASVFIRDGLDAMVSPDSHVQKLRKVEPLLEKLGLPPVLTADARMLARFTGAVTLISGLGLATGKAPRLSAFALAALNFPITVVNNPLWAAKSVEEQDTYSRGLLVGAALTGGLGMAILDLEGRPSWEWQIRAKHQAHRLSRAHSEAQPTVR